MRPQSQASRGGLTMPSGNGSAAAMDLSGLLEWRLIGPHRGGPVVAVAGDPRDPMVVYFGACAGGVWKTTDGGTYLETVSDGFLSPTVAGAIDLSMDPSTPRILYAAFWEPQATPSSPSSGGPGSRLSKSTDGGDPWTERTTKQGLRAGFKGKIAVAVPPANPDRVWALVE